MGFLDNILPITTVTSKDTSVETIDAAYQPIQTALSLGQFVAGAQSVGRDEAMGVPTIARARGVICSTLGGLYMKTRSDNTGEELPQPRVINQPDPRIAGSVFWSWMAEDLWLSGVAYARVLNRYADTGRIQAMERIAPSRVTTQTNALGTEIVKYMVDGYPIDMTDLVIFNGLDEGVLHRAGRTIKAAHALEVAAHDFALNPVPQTVLKSTGAMLPKERVQALLNGWRNRKSQGTAFLNADVTLETVGFDPKSLQMNEARMYVSLELCRAANLPAYFASAEPSSFTYSNLSSERRSLIDFSIRNIMSPIEQRMSLSDFTPLGQTVRYDLDDFLRGNALERAQVYEILNRIGAMSVEEIREEEDLLK